MSDINDRKDRVVGKQGWLAKALVHGRNIELAEEPVRQGVQRNECAVAHHAMREERI